MQRSKHARAVDPGPSPSGEPASPPTALRLIATPVLCTAKIDAIEGDALRIDLGGQLVAATRDAAVHPAVLEGAASRGERVLVERDASGAWTVLGALRTQPTPGVDVTDQYTIEADRVTIRGRTDVTLTSDTAGLVVRALGEVESYADRIISRAESVHKIIGRILRRN
ncbi:MAG: hypothetical protein U0359_18085 [Byssovorax sp.]